MGKSPAKWIKGVLFGKKSARSHGSKGRNTVATNDNGYNIGQGLHALAGSSPVISDPVLVSTVGNGIVPELERGATSNISKAVTLPTNLDIDNQGSAGTRASNDVEKLREEQAAIKAQTAFRGYLARKAYHALRGIIRLQALVRGHLVRRQAVATLRSIQGIVKIQALVRAQRVRRSGVGLEIYTKFGQRKAVDTIPSDTWKEKVATNAFICKLLSSSPVAIPLQVQYDEMEPNSVSNWLERWTSSHPLNTISQPKKNVDSKSHTKRGSNAIEIETGRPKRSVRRNPEFTSDPEKPKRNPRKVSSSPVESAREPQTELEKVKRNLRKVSSMMAEVSNHPEVDIEKPNHSLRKMPNSKPFDESVEKVKEENPLALDTKLELESSSKLVAVEEPVGALLDNDSPLESHPLQSIDKEENLDMTNGELSPKVERASHESQKTSKRRASFSAKTECADNDLQNTPPVPSYMAKTESSKAKFRGQNSPSFGSDSGDRNGLTRRHSLPSSTNGKLSLQSPRTQKLVQASSKGSAKTDRSLLSSRDGNERPIQVDWKR